MYFLNIFQRSLKTFIGDLHFISYHQKDHNFSNCASSAQTHFKMMEQPEMLETHFFRSAFSLRRHFWS